MPPRRFKLIGTLLFLALAGCGRFRFRPAGVPSSAEWVAHTFIDCAIDTSAKSNFCTVYKDDTGEILAEGSFILNNTHGPAAPSQRQYAGFSDRGISLQDTHFLFQISASPRDPSHRVMAERLRAFASRDGYAPIDCGAPNTSEPPGRCAQKAFAAEKPFYVRWYFPGDLHFSYAGIAMDHEGVVRDAFYSQAGTIWLGVKPEDLFDGGRIAASVCPAPVILTEDVYGVLR
jgi:hypothetical protein